MTYSKAETLWAAGTDAKVTVSGMNEPVRRWDATCHKCGWSLPYETDTITQAKRRARTHLAKHVREEQRTTDKVLAAEPTPEQPPPFVPPARDAICPICRARVSLTRSGKLRWHGVPGCDGSGLRAPGEVSR